LKRWGAGGDGLKEKDVNGARRSKTVVGVSLRAAGKSSTNRDKTLPVTS